jgi:voltage-gated potassium channel
MMFKYILQRFVRYFSTVSFQGLLIMFIGHFLLTYALFWAAGEDELVSSLSQYFYYWVVTGSTVGYGDMGPSTQAGQMITALVMIPFALGVFGIVLTKAGNMIMTHLRKEIHGMRDFSKKNGHILIVGYHPVRTQEIINLILGDKFREKRMILVATDDDVEHPFLNIDGVEFCRVDSLKDATSLSRMGLAAAEKIIVDNDDDNVSFVLSAHYAAINPDAHISTHIADVVIAENLQNQYANVEVVVDNSEELMVRTMQDNGTSRTVSQLLRADEGQTFYVLKYNVLPGDTFAVLRERLNHKRAILIGIAYDKMGRSIVLNPDSSTVLEEGTTVYLHYISDGRVLSL